MTHYNLTEGHEITKDAALESEIKRYTEEQYNETFGNGQRTLDEFDWEDIAVTIEEAAHHFALWKESQSHWKPSEEQMDSLRDTEGGLTGKIKKVLIENGYYVGSYEATKVLREIADEWDD